MHQLHFYSRNRLKVRYEVLSKALSCFCVVFPEVQAEGSERESEHVGLKRGSCSYRSRHSSSPSNDLHLLLVLSTLKHIYLEGFLQAHSLHMRTSACRRCGKPTRVQLRGPSFLHHTADPCTLIWYPCPVHLKRTRENELSAVVLNLPKFSINLLTFSYKRTD